MKTLNYQLKQLCKNNRDGSYGTQNGRSRMLNMMADQLDSMGYRSMKANSLKPKHVIALTNLWNTQGISIGSQKIRLSTLRWWAKKIGKQNVIAKNNTAYRNGSRTFVAKQSKSQELGLPPVRMTLPGYDWTAPVPTDISPARISPRRNV